jgi:hypothetical protein
MMAPELIADWELERYILGECPPRRLEEIRILVERNAELRDAIERLERSNQDILERFPPSSIVPRILKRSSPHSHVGTRLLSLAPVLASALLLIFIVFRPDRTSERGNRIKGADVPDLSQTQILIYRKGDHDVEKLGDGARVRAGDLLQIAYVAADQKYGVILSIDGRGLVTLHFPEDEASSARLVGDRLVTTLSAYELDDAPGFERFFFITSKTEIDTRDLVERARDLAKSLPDAQKERLNLPRALSQHSILLKKG